VRRRRVACISRGAGAGAGAGSSSLLILKTIVIIINFSRNSNSICRNANSITIIIAITILPPKLGRGPLEQIPNRTGFVRIIEQVGYRPLALLRVLGRI